MKFSTAKLFAAAILLFTATHTMAASVPSTSLNVNLQRPADAEISILRGAGDIKIDPLWMPGNGIEEYLQDIYGLTEIYQPRRYELAPLPRYSAS